jgi:hypothetical protein
MWRPQETDVKQIGIARPTRAFKGGSDMLVSIGAGLLVTIGGWCHHHWHHWH